MTRIKRGVMARKRHKKILKLAKGYRHGRKNLYRQAKEAVLKASKYAYRDRRTKKRAFRSLWIVQLNAVSRANDLKYSEFIRGLKLAKIELDRKILADLAEHHPEEFQKVIDKVKNSLIKEKD